MEDPAEVRVQHPPPVLVGHAQDQAVPGQARVVDQDVEVARLLDEPGGLLGIGDVGLDRAPADLRGQRLRLLGAAAIADDDRRARARQLRRDRTADPPRCAGDERQPPLQRAEAPASLIGSTPEGFRGRDRHGGRGLEPLLKCECRWGRGLAGETGCFPRASEAKPSDGHAVCRRSLSFSTEARSLTGIVFTLRSIRFISPESTLPGPTSTNVFTPSRHEFGGGLRVPHRRGQLVDEQRPIRWASSNLAVTVDMNAACGSPNLTDSIAGRSRSAARATQRASGTRPRPSA